MDLQSGDASKPNTIYFKQKRTVNFNRLVYRGCPFMCLFMAIDTLSFFSAFDIFMPSSSLTNGTV